MQKSIKLNHKKIKLEIENPNCDFEIQILNFHDSYYKISELFFTYDKNLVKEINIFENLLDQYVNKDIDNVLVYCELFHTTMINPRLDQFLETYKYSVIKNLYTPINTKEEINKIINLFFKLTKQENMKIFRESNIIQDDIIWGVEHTNVEIYYNKVLDKILNDKNICDFIFTYLIFELINPYYLISKDVNFVILVNQLINKLNINPTLVYCLKDALVEFKHDYLQSWSVFYEDGNLTELISTFIKIINKSINDSYAMYNY